MLKSDFPHSYFSDVHQTNCSLQTVPKPLAVRPSDGNTNYTVVGGEPKKNRRSKREAIIPAEEFIDSSGRSLSVVIMVGALRHTRHYLIIITYIL